MRTPKTSRLLCLVLLLASVGCATRRPAQSFEQLQQRIRPGHTVYVIDDAC